MKHILFLILFFSYFIYSCSPPYGKKEYVEFILNPENKLSSQLIKNNILFKVQYQTPEYLALKELRGRPADEDAFARELLKFKDYMYLDFSMTSLSDGFKILDKSDTSVYESRLRTLSFGMEKFIYALNGHDTLRCLMSQFVYTGNISPEYHFQLLFPKPETNAFKFIQFHYNDTIFHNGVLKLNIAGEDLIQIPKLKI